MPQMTTGDSATQSMLKSESFLCCDCGGSAHIIYGDGKIKAVACPACDVSVVGCDAVEMHHTLRNGTDKLTEVL